MSETSARPENLAHYVERVRTEKTTLAGHIETARTSFTSFANANPFPVEGGNLFSSVLPALESGIDETTTFVDLVRTALIDADNHDGVSTMGTAAFDAAVRDAASANGIDYDSLRTAEPPLEVVPPAVGAVPETSGYVDDPVCTATGHFVEDQFDFLMPPRVQSLTWTRRYASRLLATNALGRGWFTWADVEIRPVGAEWLLVTDQGRQLTLPDLAIGDDIAICSQSATVERTEQGWTVAWGIDSPYGLETWHFDGQGRLLDRDGWRGGITRFHRIDDRLVEMVHESGRSLTLAWADDRIVSVTTDDGRQVTYHHSPAGDLHRIDSPLGGFTFDTDNRGRISEVTDADGVVVCINWYDADGRVLRQANPGRRISLFEYLPGRVTRVLDADSNLVARYEHDESGRLTRFVTPEGARLERSFGERGETTGMRSHDGSAFVANGDAGPDGTWQIDHADGRTEHFTYDALGRVATWQLHDGPVTRFAYEGRSEQPSSVTTDGLGTTTTSFTASGLLAATIDADGIATSYDIDDEGLIRTVTDGAGRTTSFEAHPTGMPARVTDAAGTVSEFGCDAGGRLTSVTRDGTREVEIHYSAAGRVARIVDAAGGTVTIDHDSDGFAASVRDENGDELHITRDTWGRPATFTLPDGTVWQLDHTRLGELQAVQAPSGARWTKEFDDQHRPVGTTDPCGRTAAVHLDQVGRPIQRDGGTELAQTYDDNGRVAKTRVGAAWTQTTWDPFGRLAATVDGDGVTKSYTWSPAGRATGVSVGADTTSYRYDDAGAIVASDGPTGSWSYEYDQLGRLVEARSPEGRVSRYRWDELGRAVFQHEPNGTREASYDRLGRVVAETVNGRTTSLAYDAVGNLTTVTAPGGTRTGFRYDVNGRLTAQLDPLGGQTINRWNDDGRLVERTDQLGRTTRFDHDASGLLVKVTDAEGRELRYGYDDRGDLTTVTDGDTVLVDFAHTVDGTLAAIAEPGQGRTLEFATTPGGRLAGWRTGDDPVLVSHTDGRVTARHGGGLPEVEWTHTPQAMHGTVDGRRAGLTSDRDGSTTGLEWGDRSLHVVRDEQGRITEVASPEGPQVVVERDERGRTIAITDHGATTRYAYDEVGRLARASGDDGESTWSYDAAGRLASESGPQGSRTYLYDAAHQLVEVLVDGVAHTSMRYDAAGRRIEERRPDRVRQYCWDAIGRLVAVVDDGHRTEVDIDGLGLLRRVGASTVEWDLTSALPVPAAVDGSAVLTMGRRIVAVGDELVPTALLGGTGLDPWGHASEQPAVQADVGLAGGLGFCGLIWLGARIYDPATRQFLTTDPVGGLRIDNAHAHPYAYVDHDPLNRWDPTGLSGQAISIDDFNQARDQATEGNWKGVLVAVAATVIVVAATVLIPGAGGPLAMMAIGGVVGAAAGGTTAALNGGSMSDIVKASVIGGVFGVVGGGFGAATSGARATALVAASSRPALTRVAIEGGSATVQGFSQEAVTAAVEGRDFSLTGALVTSGVNGAGAYASTQLARVTTASTPAAPTLTQPSGLILPGSQTISVPPTGPTVFHGETYVPNVNGTLLVPAGSEAAAAIPRAPLTGSTSFGGSTYQPSPSGGLWIPAP